MLPKEHIIGGIIFSSIVLFLFPQIGLLGFFIIFLSSFAIDIDHYLYFVYRTKKLSIKKSISWYFINKDLFDKMSDKEKDQIFTGLCFLHGIEAMIILAILSFIFPTYSSIFIYILLGFLFHQILDAIHLYIIKYRFDKVISFIYSVQVNKKRKLLQELKTKKKK